MYDNVACRFDGCTRWAVSRNLCHTHNQQLRRTGELRPVGWRPPRELKSCSEDGCDRQAEKRGLCGTHYRQWQRYRKTQEIRQSPGRYLEPSGYVRIRRPDSPESRRGWGLEHRIVMSDLLGRKLWPDESVHHKNGDKQDNRPENLELWSRWQPAGQRVEDKVAYAKELLARYEPTALM